MGKLLTVFFIFMHLFSIKCMGMVISISLLWNGNHSPNIQAGSIVQVLAYSSAAEPPVADPDESFNEVGDDIYDRSCKLTQIYKLAWETVCFPVA